MTDEQPPAAARNFIGPEDRRIAQALYRDLESRDVIPRPWSMAEFVSACAEISGRSISLVAQPPDFWQSSDPGDCMTGMMITLPDRHLVLYRSNASIRYQEHQIAHELAHLLFEHNGAGRITDRQIQALFGGLFTSTEAVREALAAHNRAGLSNAQERQAEAFADVLLFNGYQSLDPTVEHTRKLFGFR
ncbi:hypothetical protein [Mycobacteroides salmoniphilum]|uniref:IrrE N-terminal-like domain-containing protein n=1 Tax=Mycobacteroides salmoniphilum TaxID=404941 RepID=A0A4R8T1A3_9MYCO|nr:hypothetical protein [Mycobacteroides salmoniphilum]TEA09188.1 hypothetical protein CCUG60884_00178 [Mycobacteroides salmoniphilum]